MGVLYLSESNEEVLSKMFKKRGLTFEELYIASPHVFICKEHPLAAEDSITMEQLMPYPYLVFEQGERLNRRYRCSVSKDHRSTLRGGLPQSSVG